MLMIRVPLTIAFMTLAGLLATGTASAELELSSAVVERLKNGMTVILLEDRNFPVVSVQMVYKVGARNETVGLTGLAHFVEHIAFRGSENFPGTGLVSNIYARGGEWHGYTWTDLTTYFATVPARELDLLLRIEADRMSRLEFSREIIEVERGAVLAEMHMYEDEPSSMLIDALMFVSFLAHPYRNNTIGFESDIENVTFEDVRDFYDRHYHPGNAVLAVVGDFDRAATLSRIEELFGSFEGRPATPLPHTEEPLQAGERRVRVTGTADARQFAIGYRAPSSTHPDYPAFLVLQALLGSSSGASFLQNDWGTPVRNEGMLAGAAPGITTWFPPSAQDYAFVISGRPDTSQSEADVENAIEARLASLRNAPPARELLEAAISNVVDELVFDIATTEDAAHQLAYFESIGGLEALLDLPRRVAAVTAEDVRRVAAAFLAPERRTIAWYEAGDPAGPRPGRTAVDAPKAAVASAPPDRVPVPPPSVHKLGGGLPVVIRESDLSPTAAVKVVVAGNRLDAEELSLDDPLRGFSAFDYRLRPADLGAVLERAAAAVAATERAAANPAPGAADPQTRLEETFASLIVPAAAPLVPDATPVLIVISGDVETDETLALLETHFGDVVPPTTGRQTFRPVPAGHRLIELPKPVAQAALGYIVTAPGMAARDYDAWRILLYVLSHGYEGRLGVEAIANRGLAYYVGSRYRSDGPNGWITLSIGVDPGKIDALRALLVAELERLVTDPPDAAEVAEGKAYIMGRFESSRQSNAELADGLAAEWLGHGRIVDAEALQSRLHDVSVADVRRAAADFVNGMTIEVRYGAQNAE